MRRKKKATRWSPRQPPFISAKRAVSSSVDGRGEKKRAYAFVAWKGGEFLS